MSRVSKTWVRMPSGRNICLYGDGFYISYNGGNWEFSGFAGDDYDETAICKDDKFYILNGDFREKYEALLDKGFEACINFFLENEDKRSSWSNEYEQSNNKSYLEEGDDA